MQIEKVCSSPNLSKQDRDHMLNETLIAGHPEAKILEKIDGLRADGNGTSRHPWLDLSFQSPPSGPSRASAPPAPLPRLASTHLVHQRAGSRLVFHVFEIYIF